MAGGAVKYRHLQRDSAHRRALLRNLVTSLFTHESIHTTWPKAKEAQRLAEKLVTLGKRNTEAARRRAHSIFFLPHSLVPKLFTTIRNRYNSRPGGYTRVLRTEPLKTDQAPSAILELVDGPKDIRYALTAQTIARDLMLNRKPSSLTMKNAEKVVKFREGAVKPGTVRRGAKEMEAVEKSGVDVSDQLEHVERAAVKRLLNGCFAKDGDWEGLKQSVMRFMILEKSGARDVPDETAWKKKQVYPDVRDAQEVKKKRFKAWKDDD